MQTTEFNKLQPGLDWVGVLIINLLNLILYPTALNLIIKKLKQKIMQCFSTEACHLERARGLGDLKRGIRGRLRNLSPLVSLLNNFNKKKFTNLI